MSTETRELSSKAAAMSKQWQRMLSPNLRQQEDVVDRDQGKETKEKDVVVDDERCRSYCCPRKTLNFVIISLLLFHWPCKGKFSYTIIFF